MQFGSRNIEDAVFETSLTSAVAVVLKRANCCGKGGTTLLHVVDSSLQQPLIVRLIGLMYKSVWVYGCHDRSRLTR